MDDPAPKLHEGTGSLPPSACPESSKQHRCEDLEFNRSRNRSHQTKKGKLTIYQSELDNIENTHNLTLINKKVFPERDQPIGEELFSLSD